MVGMAAVVGMPHPAKPSQPNIIPIQKTAPTAGGAILGVTEAEEMVAGIKSNPRLARGTALNALFLFCIILTEHTVAGHHWLPRIILEMPQYPLALPTLILLLLAIHQKKRLLIGWNVVCLLMFVEFLLGYNVPFGRHPDRAGTTVRIISYNIRHGAQGIEPIANILQRQQADVICLQETDAHRLYPDPVPLLKQFFPSWHVARVADVTTISRYPFRSTRTHPLSPATHRVILETVIDIDGSHLTVFNLHYAVRPQAIPRKQVSWLTYMHNKARLATEQSSQMFLRTACLCIRPFSGRGRDDPVKMRKPL